MANTAALNANIIGANLVSNATAWKSSANCGQDLLIVVGGGLPSHKGTWGDVIEDTNDLSTIAGVFANTVSNFKEVWDMFPSDKYKVYKGTMRGETLVIKTA